MSGYAQLIQGQRYQIEALRKAGHNQTVLPMFSQSTNQRLAVSYSVTEFIGVTVRNKLILRVCLDGTKNPKLFPL
jgi:hypothetical protein